MTPKRSGKTRAEPRHNALTFWKKGQRFAHSATANAAAGDWDPAVANAVNAVINISDAICVHYMGVRSAGDSHHDAVNLLGAATDMSPEVRAALTRQLEALLNMKTIAQYEGRLLAEKDAEKALKAMTRAFEAVRPLAMNQGWPL